MTQEQTKISKAGFNAIYRAVESAIVFSKLGSKENSAFCKSYNYLQSAKFIRAHMHINPFTRKPSKQSS